MFGFGTDKCMICGGTDMIPETDIVNLNAGQTSVTVMGVPVLRCMKCGSKTYPPEAEMRLSAIQAEMCFRKDLPQSVCMGLYDSIEMILGRLEREE